MKKGTNHSKFMRGLAILLSAVLVFQSPGIVSYGEEYDADEEIDATVDFSKPTGICPHHTEHTPACGYAEGTETSECTHVHTDACMEEVLVCEKEEHVHTQECYEDTLICDRTPEEEAEDQETEVRDEEEQETDVEEHIHTQGCYEQTLICELEEHTHDENCYETEPSACSHVHDASCGYEEGTEAAACGYICYICKIQSMIDALPDVSDITQDNYESVYERLYDIGDKADQYLSDEEYTLVDFTRYDEAGEAVLSYLNADDDREVDVPVTYSIGAMQPIEINASSLNANTIWGLGETFSFSNIYLDNWGAFYAKSSGRNSGYGGLPVNGLLTTPDGVTYHLATGDDPAKAYDGNDSIRLQSGTTTATLNLDTVGAYRNIYVLATAAGPGTGHYAIFNVKLSYTDNTYDSKTYYLYDWYDGSATNQNGVTLYDNIYRINKSGGYECEYKTNYGYAPFLFSAAIQANSSKLLKCITFTLQGTDTNSNSASGIYCGIYAVTGEVSPNAPASPVISAGASYANGFDVQWKEVSGATTYYMDIAKDQNYQTLLSGYNNQALNLSGLTTENVIAVTSNGSASTQAHIYDSVEAVRDAVAAGSLTNLRYLVTKDANGKITCMVEDETNITQATCYYVRLRAANSYGQSLSSNVEQVHTSGLPRWAYEAGFTDENASYDPVTGTLTVTDDITLSDSIKLPDGAEVTIDLNNKTITAPEGQPAIEAEEGATVKLTVSDTSEENDGKIVANDGKDSEDGNGTDGQPAIDFSSAQDGSEVKVTEGASVLGGNGGSATGENGDGGNGGAAILGGDHTSVTVDKGADATGGNGGNGSGTGSGGDGGDGINGSSVALGEDAKATGGNGGDGGNASDTDSDTAGGNGGDGGNGVSGSKKVEIDKGTSTGGDGGNAGAGATAGNGGDGATGEGSGVEVKEGGTSTGGDGGNAGAGGTAGDGGNGASSSNGPVSVGGESAGGNGGNAGDGGTAGDGGNGASSDQSKVEIKEGATSSGGDGGSAEGDGTGGNGGNGASGNQVKNNGETTGGDGGNAGSTGTEGSGGKGADQTTGSPSGSGSSGDGEDGAATELPIWVLSSGLRDEDVEYDPDTNTLKLKRDVTLKKPLVIPENENTVLDLNGHNLTGPEGQPAITASGSNPKLQVTDTSGNGGSVNGGDGKDGGSGTGSGADGAPAIDFGDSDNGSVTVDKGVSVKGGDGGDGSGTNSNGGDGATAIAGGNGTKAELKEGASAAGGDGGNATGSGKGGDGGDGVNAQSVTIGPGSSASGGDGGSTQTGIGGNGGNGASGDQITNNGNTTGGNGGGSESAGTAGTGGSGAKQTSGTPSGSGSSDSGEEGNATDELPDWAKAAGLDKNEVSYDQDTNTLTLRKDTKLDSPLIIPDDPAVTLDLNGKKLEAPDNKPAIQANGNTPELKITDSSPSGGGSIVGSDGEDGVRDSDDPNGSDAPPVIDFSESTNGSIDIDGNVTVTGGNGGDGAGTNSDGGNGGTGVLGGNNTNVKVQNGADVAGGTGGNATGTGTGGDGGDGINADSVIIGSESSATGGNGGNTQSGTGGSGGNGASGENVNNSGTTAGGNGGNASSSGTGGNGGSGIGNEGEGGSSSNSGTATGGTGGNGGNPGNGGNGAPEGTVGEGESSSGDNGKIEVRPTIPVEPSEPSDSGATSGPATPSKPATGTKPTAGADPGDAANPEDAPEDPLWENEPDINDGQPILADSVVDGDTVTVSDITVNDVVLAQQLALQNGADADHILLDLRDTESEVQRIVLPTEDLQNIMLETTVGNIEPVGLTVILPDMRITFSYEALLAVISQATGDTLELVVDVQVKTIYDYTELVNGNVVWLNEEQLQAISDMDVQHGFEVYWISNNVRIGDFKGGVAELYVEYEVPEGYDGNKYVVYYISDAGELHPFATTYDGTYLRFIVDHFSDFLIVYEGNVNEEQPVADSGIQGGGQTSGESSQMDDEPKTGDTAMPITTVATLTMIGGFLYLMEMFREHKIGMTKEQKDRLVQAIIRRAKGRSYPVRILALGLIFMLLLFYHSIGKRVEANVEELSF